LLDHQTGEPESFFVSEEALAIDHFGALADLSLLLQFGDEFVITIYPGFEQLGLGA
jgi:hypothetical protein